MESQKFNKSLHKILSDKQAIVPIYQEFYAKIVVHLRFRFGNSICPEDIAQEVFASLLNTKPANYIEAPQRWLFALADNKAIDFLRRQQNEIAFSDDMNASPVCEIPTQNITIRLAFEHIDPQSQKILMMHFWEGYNYKEIAEALNLSCGNVRLKASRAYKILKDFL